MIYINNIKFKRNEEKNFLLKNKRWITFEEIIHYINSWNLIEIIPHHNTDKYPNQKIFAVLIDWYVWAIPFIKNWDIIFLKTAYKDRNLKSFYIDNIK